MYRLKSKLVPISEDLIVGICSREYLFQVPLIRVGGWLFQGDIMIFNHFKEEISDSTTVSLNVLI